MKTIFKENDKLLIIYVTEEIDHHSAKKLRSEVDNEIEKYLPKKVIIDFANASFMDSAGIGFLIGRYKIVHLLRRMYRNSKCK